MHDISTNMHMDINMDMNIIDTKQTCTGTQVFTEKEQTYIVCVVVSRTLQCVSCKYYEVCG